jgi:hypothetical protein
MQERVRKIILADKPSSSTALSAAERVTWMDGSVLQELETILIRDKDLNHEQRDIMLAAAERTLTLMQVSHKAHILCPPVSPM